MMIDVQNILSKLTLEEKCALCSGINFWKTTPIKTQGVPSVVMSDGPHGLRKEKATADVANVMQESEKSTCFPTAVTVASSWDPDLAGKVASAIADEAIDQGVDVVLGPGINIKRNPLCGRNFEYFSEDPFLAGELGVAYVNAMQAKNVGTSLKHYAVNSQEYKRMTVSSEVDERALREIYLPAFENTVKKAQPYTVMCSYNPVNGVHASENKKLLTDILREEWGFEGIVVSDWGAVNDRVKGILAGMDLQMPADEGIADREIAEAVKKGAISEADVDKIVVRMLEFIDRCLEDRVIHGVKKADYEANFELAGDVAAQSAVLLKNNGILPLSKGKNIAVIGSLAKVMRYQGSGSSRINPYKLTSFTEYLDELKVNYTYAAGYDSHNDKPDKELIDRACKVAEKADTVLLFIGLTDTYESEGFDRRHLGLPDSHNALVEAVLEKNKNVVIVLSGGSPVEMPWINEVPAVLNMYLAGSAGGKACYKLLYGEVNPSGKLAETFPLSIRDNPSYLYYQMGPRTVEYRESIFVGYRYFDTAKKEVLFPFGYGLSYTQFEYSDLKFDKKEISDGEEVKVAFKVKNVGATDGAEIAQLYVKDVESSIFREEKALKGFKKVFLKAGESAEIEITLDKRSFAFYNTAINDWCVESGDFEILVGASSRDIRLKDIVKVNAAKTEIPDYKDKAPVYYNIAEATEFSAIEFEALLGRPLVDNVKFKKGEIDYNSTVDDIGTCWIGKLLRWATYTFSGVVLPKGSPDYMKKMVQLSALGMPLRNIYAMTNGMIQKKVVDGLIKRCNGRPFNGIGMILSGLLGKKPVKKSAIYKD